MKRITASLVCLLVLSTLFSSSAVNARPIYKSVFTELYSPGLPRVKMTCAVCHPGKQKRELTRYGKALAEALGRKNVKDRERIRRAMKAIEHRFPGLPKIGN